MYLYEHVGSMYVCMNVCMQLSLFDCLHWTDACHACFVYSCK